MEGVIWAMVAGVSFGLFQAVNRRGSRDVDNYVATFVLLVMSAVALGTATLLTQDLGPLFAAPASALGWFAVAGAIHFFLGWTFLGLSQRRIGAARTGVLIGTTPLFGTAIAFVVLGEFVRPTALAGVALVVAGIFLLSGTRISGSVGDTAGTGVTFGLLTAICWGVSPVFVRWGLEQMPVPLIGVTVGMAASAAAYGLALLVRGQRLRGSIPQGAWGLLGAAGALVALGIGSLWVALSLAPVAIVLALNQLALLTVIVTAPFIVGGAAEKLTVWTGTGAFLVLTGTLLIIFARTPLAA